VSVRAPRRLGAALSVALVVAACGKKGDPLPPLQIVPARVTDLTASLGAGRIQLQFTVPAGDPQTGLTVAPERIEIYRVVTEPEAPVPPAAQIVGAQEYLRGELVVRRADVTPPAGPSTTPAPGEPASFSEEVDLSSAGAWTFVAVGAIGRNRRGPASAIVTVPVGNLPPAPDGIQASNDETSIRLTWQGAGPAYRVFHVGAPTESNPAGLQLLTGQPLTTTEFVQPVEFGRERCFVVRSVRVTGPVTVEGPASVAECLTPVDRYPPPAPSNLRVIQEGSGITLTWTPVVAADLAGYVVLRGDESGVNMMPLVRDPVRDTTFTDTTVQRGASYAYSVYAVDNAPVANVSQQSDRQVVTVR
jgi:hypothetical protein